MLFYSTNRLASPVDFKTALFEGLADDGGLFMPEKFPKIFVPPADGLREIAFGVAKKFTDIPAADLKKIIKAALNFPVPLVSLDKNLHILELFHGPTLSFKDFGARFMARVIDYYLGRSGEKLNIITATSGDTGGAVASGFHGLANIRVFILYPGRRISPLQEKQITALGGNVTALEVDGDFDDCQSLAKQALADAELRRQINLSSANSINIGRLLPQTLFYFLSRQKIKKPVIVVPSGNFGNLTAGLFAKKMGLKVGKFVAAVNKNSAVPEYLATGNMNVPNKTKLTLSSAMDVGNPSNWARILDLYGGNREAIGNDLEAITISESETKKTIAETYKKYKYFLDPHTAVGVAAANKLSSRFNSPFVVLATAHPAKFRDIVQSATGRRMPLPGSLVRIADKAKNSIALSVDYRHLKKILTN
ncbi:MAG: Threonine synthase [Candidatus Giovannonibacteria bacterium GW2011_GWB1_47_6b]|uniref:Threonine synthase n=1 Tax=Candidatus Giovannonibacteria bacterium GW2011_GWB1_47_6b TaxID=1618655 RepID=A0A0G1T6V7_9BACT|nr:MAG: Threonine synthase [Candidatus Giovannonibacteria bacterium GW2011_GWB1_47_6b]